MAARVAQPQLNGAPANGSPTIALSVYKHRADMASAQ
jgi:hypothetical protein